MSQFCEEEASESDEEPSSSSSVNVASELDKFRLRWHEEIGIHSQPHDTPATGLDKESEAKRLFLKGIEAERNGHTGEAIYYYRRAIHLHPDVERTIDISPREVHRERFESESSMDSLAECSSLGSAVSHSQGLIQTQSQDAANMDAVVETPDDEDMEDLDDLLARFRRLKVVEDSYCSPELDQSAKHVSDLPTEILMDVLRWVVSRHLDTKSLDNVSLVCRGFYILTRDENIWSRICKVIWKKNTGKRKQYGSWRGMYLNRPRVYFNGCYISKMSYIRPGEHSVDGFYQPVHFVEYYRFIRFYPDGGAIMLTSPAEPSVSVYKLSRDNNVQGLLVGTYKLVNNKLSILLTRTPYKYNKNMYYRHPRARQNVDDDVTEQVYHVDLEIKNCGKRRNYALLWKHYSIDTTHTNSGEMSSTVFDLTYNNYPPMYFSPVRSYVTATEGPL